MEEREAGFSGGGQGGTQAKRVVLDPRCGRRISSRKEETPLLGFENESFARSHLKARFKGHFITGTLLIDLCAANEPSVSLSIASSAMRPQGSATELEARRRHAAESFQAGESLARGPTASA